MGTYVVSGSASGMGHAAAERLRAAGHSVIGVDITATPRPLDVAADLSTAEGRRSAAEEVLAACGGALDGAILAAGVGPVAGRDRLIAQVNYFGVVELLTALRPAFARTAAAKVVVVSSNSTTTTPLVPQRAVRALLAGDVENALRAVRWFGKRSAPMTYAASKIAVSRWVRRHAVTQQWAGAGIRLNALAPGAIMTPLLAEQLADPTESKAIKAFPVPIGGYGDAGHLADWMVFMLSEAADFLCGSVIFVDGGSDAYFRSESWPAPVPARMLPRYAQRFLGYRRATRPVA
ncbi:MULTISPECIES: SDR family oxidoreductase [Mycolicibacterium]|uniref:NAD-dependent epimerase/dehydratase n=1 Tax=Mycolicibacterium vanbaalenii (strain DSM 7251 / JCM 13017 / BCRC 16820 / KCTC 9966 / NRRL B-24157 / PYR-1) TaxID=350058 RepID=A1T953_MYCVP|nr:MULTISPECIES: SDR family oxidoreductase [Mycolicibacterium]ABM13703.1 NAD-dependent epimerase/dehydratase [Mycolicibacterium vanbaalenii PYR-1]MCV7126563.1 SDR family oxidoreductase [Mycolicibacterium vanbaalenii PYR-1]PQP47359.1 NAD-dependent epimerase [Mycolicibacterium austroafricanum]